MKFKFFNDSGTVVSIHPATFVHGCIAEDKPIQPLETREFVLPTGSYPTLKIWDYGDYGLSIFVSPEWE